jgi:hypothetical protein
MMLGYHKDSIHLGLIAQIKFTEWTSDDRLRQPVFLTKRRHANIERTL